MNTKMDDTLVEAISAVMNLVYDKQGVQMLEQLLNQTKGGKDTADGIVQAVAMVASQILSHLTQKVQGLSEEQTYGEHGLVHATLAALFEVASTLGFSVPQSQEVMKEAYQIVEQALEDTPQGEAGGPPEASEGEPATPPQGQAPMAPQGLFGGLQ